MANKNDTALDTLRHDNSDGGELSERQRLILRAVVDSHIKNGEPVGSKSLTNVGGREYSSATIRNEMAALEEQGYLESPHTSSGRVPTELGYRFYVDWLRDRYEMTTRELETLNAVAAAKMSELDGLLETATKLASAMTNYTALAVKPRRSAQTVRRYETVFLDEHEFLLVMILSDDNIRTVRIYSEQSLDTESVATVSRTLNTHATGVTADRITLSVIMRMREELGIYGELAGSVMKEVYEAMRDSGGGEVRVDGVNNLLQYPEYSDISAVKDILSMLDRREDIVKLVSDANDDNVNVYIGSENSVGAGDRSSIVFRTIKHNGQVVGAIGVIGPRRMDYSRVMTLIEGLAGSISDAVSRDIPGADDKALPPGNDGDGGG